MKYILFLSLLFISLGNLIIGKKASEQFFPKIMYWLKHQEQKIDQTLAFEALSQIIKLKDQELQENTENMKAIISIQQQQISEFCHLKMSFEQNIIDQEDIFINDEIKHSSTYFENKIKDKEKMIEQDIREIEKIKKQMKDHTKQQIKLKEIQELIKEIEISLQNGTAEQLYKTLEIIESKAILGLFQSQKQYDEIDLYLKSVDQLFKTKNFQQDEFEIMNLLSMIKNVLLDMKFDILIKIQEDDINYYETIQFFENSKSTHNFALDYFKTESKEFLGQLLKIWNKQLEDQQYNYDDISQFCQFIDNYLLDIQKNGYQFKSDFIKLEQTTKKMENDFLKKNQNSQQQ